MSNDIRLFTNQVPAKPLRININQNGFSFSAYNSFTVNITDPSGVLTKSVSGNPATYGEGSTLVLPWTFLGVATTFFSAVGDYTVQVLLKNTGVEDVCTPAIIQVYSRTV